MFSGAPKGLRLNLLRFMPALNVSEGEIDLMIAMLDGLLQHWAWADYASLRQAAMAQSVR